MKDFMIKHTFYLLLLLAFLLLPSFGLIDKNDIKNPESDTLSKSITLFDNDKLLNVSLRFDLTSYLKKTLKDKSVPGVMTFHISETDTLSKKVTVKTRGIFRLENCTFAPIELNFKKGIYAYTDSDKVSKLKLVTHCESSALNDEYVLREYLVYKLLNVLTDTSFRVRLLRVSYIDTQKKRKPIIQYGFFIEPVGILAARTSSNVVKTKSLDQEHIFPYVMDRLAIFNYMIGNYDWSVPGQHNVAVILPKKNNTSGLGIAVPYDFDLTGVVNADYAIPSAATGLKSIRDRIFLGICRNKEVYQKDLEFFLSKKEELYRVITDFPYLNQKSKKDIENYLDEFFDQISRQSSFDNMISTFIHNCKK
jgi:hypothetical protein